MLKKIIIKKDMLIENILIKKGSFIYISLKEEGEKWSNEVDTKVPEKPGILSGTPEEIAKDSKKQHKGEIGKAIQGLTFRKNQAGENMTGEMKKNIDKAIEILQKENEK